MHVGNGAFMIMAPAGENVVCRTEKWYEGVNLPSLLRILLVLKVRLYEVLVSLLAECL